MLNRLAANAQNQTWLRWLVIASALTLSAGLAYQGGRLATLVLLAIPAILGVIFLLRWPQWGLVALVPAALVVPFEFGTGTQTSLNAAVLLSGGLIGLWLVDLFIIQKQFIFIRSRVFIPLMGFVITALLAFIAGQLPWFAFTQSASIPSQIGGLMIFLLSAGIFVLVAHQIKDLKWLEGITWLFLGLAAIYVTGRIIPGLGQLSGLFPSGATGSVFWIWWAALSFSQAFFNRKLKPRWRIVL